MKIGPFALSGYWRDVAWQASGNTLAQVVGVLGIPLLSRLYTPQDFAVQSLFVQVAMFVCGIMTWRFEYFVVLPKESSDAYALHKLVLVLGSVWVLLLSPILWCWRQPLAQFLGETALAPYLVWAPITGFLISWALSVQQLAQRGLGFKASGLSELAGKLSYVGVGGFGALLGLGPSALLATTASSAIGKIGFLRTPFARAQVIPQPQLGLHDALRVGREFRGLAGAMVASHVLATGTAVIPLAVIAHLYGADALGQFSLVQATIFLPSGLLGAAIGQVYYQRAAALWAEQKPFAGLWTQTVRKLLWIGLPVYALISLLSPYAYPLLFGANWALAAQMGVWMSLAALFSFVSGPLDRTALVVGAGWYMVAWYVFRVLLTAAVAALAWTQHWPVLQFVQGMVLQYCLGYALDLAMGYRFSRGAGKPF